MPFPHPLRRLAADLDAKVSASDQMMAEHGGVLIEHTGRWSREYRFDPEFLAAKQAEAARAHEAEDERHVREMAGRTQRMLAAVLDELETQQREAGPAISPDVVALLENDPLAEATAAPLRAHQVHEHDQEPELTALLAAALTPSHTGRGWRS